MRKIHTTTISLVGRKVYRERSDCSTWKIVQYNEAGNYYGAIKYDDEGHITNTIGFFTPHDLVGDYVED